MPLRQLLDLSDVLLGEGGCPWDRKQTYKTLSRFLLEEAYEVVDAIDNEDIPNLVEELGDLLYNIIFMSKLGEKQGAFNLEDVCQRIHQKLVARHPHIFGEETAADADAVIALWEKVKAGEKRGGDGQEEERKAFPALLKAYKLAKKRKLSKIPTFTTEEELGERLWALVCEAQTAKIDPEAALRRYLHAQVSNSTN